MSTFPNSEDKLSEKLHSHEFDLPSGAWEQMEELLDKSPVHGLPVQDKAVKGGSAGSRLFRVLLPVLLLLLSSAVVIFSIPQQPQPDVPVPEKLEQPTLRKPAPPTEASPALLPRSDDPPKSPSASKASTASVFSNSTNPSAYKTNSTKKPTQDTPATTNDFNSATTTPTAAESIAIQSKPLSTKLDSRTSGSEVLPPNTEKSVADKTRQPNWAASNAMPVLSPLFTKAPTPTFGRELPSINLSSLQAPNGVGRSFQFGVLMGGGLATSGLYQKGNKSTLHFGIFTNYRINPNQRLQVEAHVKHGSDYNLNTTFTNLASTPVGFQINQIELNTSELLFLEFPVLWKFRIGKERKGYVSTGARAGAVFLSGLGQNSSYNMTGQSFTEVTDNREGIRKFDLGVLVGYEWLFSPRMSLNCRYVQGVFDLTHDNWFKNESTLLNSDFQLSLRYFF